MKEKYLQIFNYLLEFSKLRSKAVRDIDNSKTNYIEVLWFNDIPKNEKIDSIIQDRFSNESDYWLKISKPVEPEEPLFPKPPKELTDWIIPESLILRNELPELLTEITGVDNQIIRLVARPDIQTAFDAYCETKWFNDSESYWRKKQIFDGEYEIYDKVNDYYKKLFSIYNKSQQFGEEYELILGVGLMNFKENDETPLICRHILTIKAEIDFEFTLRNSSLTVRQGLSDGIQIETDAIIDLFEQFDSSDIIEAERGALELIKTKELVNPFDLDIHEVLQLLAERIKPGDGTYKNEMQKAKNTPQKETIFFAPALILRKRNTQSLTALYEKIISDISEGQDINIPTLDNLIDLEESGSLIQNEPADNSEFDDTDTIYFPNKYNDEQIAIIKKARLNNKVLVQGPPGTGKSHTIANLICHLLANGKRILVTAYTKRALEVLKDKLPEEFKALTVNLLSGDSASIQDLESSVNVINDELSNTDIEKLTAETGALDDKLSGLKAKRVYDTNELLKVKEKASRKIELNSTYHGTLTEIAEKLKLEKENFLWYKDTYANTDNIEIIRQVEEYLDLFNVYKRIDKDLFSKNIPELQFIFSNDEFESICKKIAIAKRDHISKDSVPKLEIRNYKLVEDYLKELKSIFEWIVLNQHPFKNEIISSHLNHQKSIWETTTKKSNTILKEISKYELRDIDRNVEIKYPNDKSLITLKNDAKLLSEFLNAGNTLSGIGFVLKKAFLPRQIKEKFYFINSVFVNGSLCDTKVEFKRVIEDIRIKQDFIELEHIWGCIDETAKSFEAKFKFFYKLQQDTLTLWENSNLAQQKIKDIKSVSNVVIESFSLDNLNQIIKSVAENNLLYELSEFENRSKQISLYLSDGNLHPIANEFQNAIDELNVNEYAEISKQLERLNQEYGDFKSYINLENELIKSLPILISEIQNETFAHENIILIEKAILFRHAYWEVKRLLHKDYEKELVACLKSYDSEEEKLISQVASKKSWRFVLENLKKNRALRQHLEAWVQAVKKIGKTGKGKRAFKFRKVAQEEMAFCKTSIPCWIMPLYKVAETIQPEQGLFDYVIIDEASQLGPDAIFLLYISKNIIIVGDDKQTSPEYVGVEANTMTPYINRHLRGIPFKDFYGTEYSFFDHAKRFCEGVTVLREHFRCMPEIIEFSNKLFYAPDGKGLYPLKQYSENRLEPLINIFCQNGTTEGSGPSIRNKNEAIAIVNKISELVKDPKYKNKSFGVICLQGNSQSSLIETLLIKEIGESEYSKRKIICGNSASFQGDERDIVFLSLVTAQNHNRSALTRPEDERRFNVAASRAIEQMWLFHSILPEDLSNTGDLRYKILDHFLNYQPYTPPSSDQIKRTLGNHPEPFDSWFEVDVYNDIIRRGYSVKPQYEVARGKYRIDLVAFFPDGTKIAIECDGDKWHGAEKYQDDIMRQKVLERCGWQFFRIRGGEYYSNREKALEHLWNIFKDHETKSNPNFKLEDDVQTNGKEEHKATRNEISIKSDEIEVLKTIESGTKSNFKINNVGLISAIDEDIVGRSNSEKSLFIPESPTCYWSPIELPGYTYAPNKNAWYKKKENPISIINGDEIVRYFNLYNNGTYILTNKMPLKADYVLEIRKKHSNGYLLQCYDCGHINKVNISALHARKIDKEYMNGLNVNSTLKYLKIIDSEKIVGIYFDEDGNKKFKAHLTANIPSRDLLHLQGYKVIYNDYANLEYKVLPLEIYKDIDKLVFQSFAATGKPVNSTYYHSEFEILKKLIPLQTLSYKKTVIESNELELEFIKIVKAKSLVTIKYINTKTVIKIQLIDFPTNHYDVSDGIMKVHNKAPIAIAIIGKSIGDKIPIGSKDNIVQILEILN